MRAYICVYRHFRPSKRDWEHTKGNAVSRPLLRKFLNTYGSACFDWGDDPSFFAAEQILGGAQHASWGVCRRDVRGALKEGDFVVFFCARESASGVWDYYWVGLGTVKRRVVDRKKLWADPSLKPYRDFFNLLVGPDMSHRELFPDHPDWRTRIESPYLLFDPEQSRFDPRRPLHVASYDPGTGLPEKWGSRGHEVVRKLESLLFGSRTRRLRTSHTGFGHAKCRLPGDEKELTVLRSQLLKLHDDRVLDSPHISADLKRIRGYSRRRGCS